MDSGSRVSQSLEAKLLFQNALMVNINLPKRYLRKKILSILKNLPFPSNVIGPVKGVWNSSRSYYESYKADIENLQFFEIDDASSIDFRSPQTVHDVVHNPIDDFISKFTCFPDMYSLNTFPNTFVISIPNGRVLGNTGTIITHDDKLLVDVSQDFTSYFGSTRSEWSFKLPKHNHVDESVAVIAAGGADTYYHWLTDALPRVEILKKTNSIDFNAIDKILVNTGVPIIAETLKLLGIPEEKIIFDNYNLHISSSLLIVPSLPCDSTATPKWAYDFLRRSYLPLADVQSTYPKRIYISRAKASRRKVINEREVVTRLSKYGFEPIYLEELNFTQQVALFSQVEAIVALHGAGLTNLVWSRIDVKVLELFSPSHMTPCYWILANQIGANYHYLLCDEQGPNGMTDAIVDLKSLNKSVETLLR